MRESPLLTLIKMPWWLNLMIGLGMMSLGQLLKNGEGGVFPLFQKPLGDGLQIMSVFFVVLALASFMIGASNEISAGEGADTASRVHEPPRAPAAPQPGPAAHQQAPSRNHQAAAPAAPQPPPAPPKKKYSERDFMPPAMRAEMASKERKEDK